VRLLLRRFGAGRVADNEVAVERSGVSFLESGSGKFDHRTARLYELARAISDEPLSFDDWL